MSYVPIREVLQQFLQLPGVWAAIEQNKPKADGVLKRFQ